MIFKKNIDKFPLIDWITEVKDRVSKKVEKSSWVIVVLVAWWTASWKTSAVAKK